MFGLGEKNKKPGGEQAVFDLEKDLAHPGKRKEVQQRIQDRMLQIKSSLQAGMSKEQFNMYGRLLHGYASLLKIVARFGANS